MEHYKGIGKAEPLRGNLAGFCSGRIDEEKIQKNLIAKDGIIS